MDEAKLAALVAAIVQNLNVAQQPKAAAEQPQTAPIGAVTSPNGPPNGPPIGGNGAAAAAAPKGRPGRKPDPIGVRLSKALAKAGITPDQAKALLGMEPAPAPAPMAPAPAPANASAFRPTPKAKVKVAKAPASDKVKPTPSTQWGASLLARAKADYGFALSLCVVIGDAASKGRKGSGPLADKRYWKGGDNGPLSLPAYKLLNASRAWKAGRDVSRFVNGHASSIEVVEWNIDWLEGPLAPQVQALA